MRCQNDVKAWEGGAIGGPPDFVEGNGLFLDLRLP
jgi:hypothetical protein